ncbi:AraC family transcriptional regulator [Meiothermus sp. QL-1]|uniref:GyrI-like domain-containing protein n=1 Tax=Meiothermus sp. QL-1 TaxID=2058095 RepID=UPI000E0B3208|nr:GyrI-like domain-containing protein [Meiothermus sp. QL-1]RDI95978.1 AraC family transcriptional regulator [Meiothermus sp. QL-1]
MERPIPTRESGFMVAGYEAQGQQARQELWVHIESGALEQLLPKRMARGKPFVVYHSYGPEGSCAVLVGYQVRGPEDAPEGLSLLNIPSGHYLMFTAEGPQPHSAWRAWEEIRAYFAQPRAPARAYTFDFEVHENSQRASIFVAVR